MKSGQPIACIYDILSSNVDICSMEQMDDSVSVNSINTSQQQLDLLACVGRNRYVFACNLSELSTTDLSEHKIDTRDATPIRQRFYRIIHN